MLGVLLILLTIMCYRILKLSCCQLQIYLFATHPFLSSGLHAPEAPFYFSLLPTRLILAISAIDTANGTELQRLLRDFFVQQQAAQDQIMRRIKALPKVHMPLLNAELGGTGFFAVIRPM